MLLLNFARNCFKWREGGLLFSVHSVQCTQSSAESFWIYHRSLWELRIKIALKEDCALKLGQNTKIQSRFTISRAFSISINTWNKNLKNYAYIT